MVKSSIHSLWSSFACHFSCLYGTFLYNAEAVKAKEVSCFEFF